MSQTHISKFSNIFDDQEISSEKLSYYRLSQPLPSSPKKKLYRFLGVKSANQDRIFFTPAPGFFKDNFSPKSTKSFQIENSFTEHNLFENLYPQQSSKIPEEKQIFKKTPAFLEDFEHNISFVKDKTENFLEEDELFKSCESVQNTTKDTEMIISDPNRHLIVSNKIKLKDLSNFQNHNKTKHDSLKINKCSPIFYSNSSLVENFNFENQLKSLNSSLDFDLIPLPGFPPVMFPTHPSNFAKEANNLNLKKISTPEPKLSEDKCFDTNELILKQDQFMETEKIMTEDKLIDSKDLIITHEKNIETDPGFLEKEKEEFSQERIEAFKQKILLNLIPLKFQLEELKAEKFGIKNDFQKTFQSIIQSLPHIFLSNFNSYNLKKNQERRDKLLELKSNLSKTKTEYSEMKMQVVNIIEKTKETFQKELEKEVKNILRVSANSKTLKLSTNKFNEIINENYSISTQSNFCSPNKYRTAPALESQVFENPNQCQSKKNAKKKPKKVNKAIVDGMLYLLENGAVKNTSKEEEEEMEELIKTKSKEKLTTDFVLENLTTKKTRGKQLDFKEVADKKTKRRSPRLHGESPKKKVHVEEEIEKPNPSVVEEERLLPKNDELSMF